MPVATLSVLSSIIQVAPTRQFPKPFEERIARNGPKDRIAGTVSASVRRVAIFTSGCLNSSGTLAWELWQKGYQEFEHKAD